MALILLGPRGNTEAVYDEAVPCSGCSEPVRLAEAYVVEANDGMYAVLHAKPQCIADSELSPADAVDAVHGLHTPETAR